jgi:hypothetical protein
MVYELTPYGVGLKPAMRELALWGLGSIGPPTDDDDLAPGWLYGAVDSVLAPFAPPGSFEFRVESETASLVDGKAQRGPAEAPDVVLLAPRPADFYWLFVERRWDGVAVEGDRELLEDLLAAAPRPESAPVPA